ncbi:MAG TPA: cytochrome c peroxidase [Gemmatimonadales bacterium]|jgi:cytochrome c peroxidase|nr:cytochrome c peroxidase [Gemmatimonadales bacterium]
MITLRARSLGLGLLVLAAGCEGTTPTNTLPLAIDAQVRNSFQGYGVVPIGSLPAQDTALVALGQALMFDPILSGNRDVACATCHLPATAAGDGLALAIGTGGAGLGPSRTLGPGRQFVPRNAPSLLNAGLGLPYVFWDGRISRFGPGRPTTPPPVTVPPDLPNILAVQAMFPVLDRTEMRGELGDRDVFGNPNELAQFSDSQFALTWQAVMRRLLAIPEYVTKFATAFPAVPTEQLGFQHAATALAAFEMQALTKTDSPFDRYLARDDGALTIQEKRGALLFFGKAACSQCHSGPLLGGNEFANTGVPQIGPGVGAAAPLDLGRGGLANNSFYPFAFRVAPLRNVELTAPYMHDGAFATLEAVVRHYNDAPAALRQFDASQLTPAVHALYHGDAATIDSVLAHLDSRVRPLSLSDAEQSDLVAFLRSLTDPTARDLSALVPARVPSGLPVPH